MDIETKGILIKLINILVFGDTDNCDGHSHDTFEDHDKRSLNDLLDALEKL